MSHTAQTTPAAPEAVEAPVESRSATMRRRVGQFVKFGMVGGSGVVVNMVIAFVMTKLHGGTSHDNDPLWFVTSRHAFRFTHLVWIVAFVLANFWNFQLNRSWTFKRDVRRGWWAEFWPFFAVGSIAALVGLFLKGAMTNPTSPIYLPSALFNNGQGLRARAYWSQLFTIVLTLPINFVVNKLWTFRAVAHHEPGADDLPMVASVVDPEEVSPSGEVESTARG